MTQLLVRDISEEIAAALKKQAAKNGRSAEAEHRAILEAALTQRSHDFWKEADRLRQELEDSGRTFTDSTQFIREDRDRR